MKRRRFAWWTLPVLSLCAIAIFLGYTFVKDRQDAERTLLAMQQVVLTDTFYEGITVDGIALHGLTLDEARTLTNVPQAAIRQQFGLFLTAGDYVWHIGSEDVPLTFDTESLLRKAYAIGRKGTLEERFAAIERLKIPAFQQMFESQYTFDASAVRRLTDSMCERLTMDGLDATVTAFDVGSRTFVFTDEQYGQSVDAKALYQDVLVQLTARQYGGTMPVAVTAIHPKVTRSELESAYGKIASFTTKTTNDANRNTNIRLAADALNGVMVLPGATISFNETTGQRTKDKGYQEAGAIENGRTIQETGGGVCQVSSTMFNALMRAGATIVKRTPHAWPSDYVPRGEDATVDWPRLDIIMRNESPVPMFLTAWYQDRTITVEVYGLSLGDGITLNLFSETTYTRKPGDREYVFNPLLRLGTTEKTKNARTGYTVQTYLVKSQFGVEIAREAVYTSDYKMIPETYEYNDGIGQR